MLIPYCFNGKVFFLSKTHHSITSLRSYLHQCPFSHYPNLSFSAHNAQTSGILKFLPEPVASSSHYPILLFSNTKHLTVSRFSFFIHSSSPCNLAPSSSCTTETAMAKITKDLLIGQSDYFLLALIFILLKHSKLLTIPPC